MAAEQKVEELEEQSCTSTAGSNEKLKEMDELRSRKADGCGARK